MFWFRIYFIFVIWVKQMKIVGDQRKIEVGL